MLEVVVDRLVLIPVQDSVGGSFVLIALLRERAVDRKRGPATLYLGSSIDPVRPVEEWHVPPSEGKPGR